MSSTTFTGVQRGTILRNTQNGDGLVSIAGQQHAFKLESHWQSDQPPSVGAKVDVQFDAAGQLISLRSVSEADLARELADQAGQQLQHHARLWSGRAKSALGTAPLIALGAVLLGWFAFDLVSIRVFGSTTATISMWQALQMMNASTDLLSAMQGGQASAGLWGWLMIVAAVAPFAPVVWNTRRAQLGLIAPLVFMAIQGLRFYMGVRSSVNAMADQSRSFFGQAAAQAAQNMSNEIIHRVSQSTSFSLGFYLSVTGALVLTGYGLLRFKTRAI